MLDKKYDHVKVEKGKNEKWIINKLFVGKDSTTNPYSITIPPPNVTGKLHIGHAWDVSLQDFLVRYKKLQGFDTLWFAGMDHAGIATQAKVEEKLKKNNISRHDLGREKFLEKVWEWKDEYAKSIRSQWAKLGLALDYSREKFTLDKDLSDLVNKTFIEMYKNKNIYRGKRVINWDPVLLTALSNIEVYHEDRKGKMYHFNYKCGDSNLEVATTRPETMFGDSCLVVNPKDERYSQFIGKQAINPSNGVQIKIIADSYVDIEFGTGVMKCTPAHDFNDFIIGKKYDLEMNLIMNKDGTMNELCGDFKGLDRFECRKKIIEKCKLEDTFVKETEHNISIALSERSGAIIEPYLSDQWFVAMKDSAKDVLKIQKTNKRVNFFPKRFSETLNKWMEEIHDWCISRQIWWGHRIPAWYKGDEIKVQLKSPGKDWVQDEDVLDTWFSSQLWPFAVTGYGFDKELFESYFPNSVLVTAYDIIFFWVSRMMTASVNEFKKMPFKDVLIHGLIRAEDGKKMSKSLNNGVDPMDIIDEFGADTLRYFLLTNSSPGQDLRYSKEKMIASKNFINKIYNAAKFVELKCDDDIISDDKIEKLDFNDFEKWVILKFNHSIDKITINNNKYEFVIAAKYLHDFVWNDFCSWFIELSKYSERKETMTLLKWMFSKILILLNPLMPFITDELFENICRDKHISLQKWPNKIKIDTNNNFKSTIEVILKIRELRASLNVGKKFAVEVVCGTELLISKSLISSLEKVTIIDGKNDQKISFVYDSGEDKNQELKLKEIKKIESEIMRAKKMLANKNFIKKASKEKVESEREKLILWKEKLVQIKK